MINDLNSLAQTAQALGVFTIMLLAFIAIVFVGIVFYFRRDKIEREDRIRRETDERKERAEREHQRETQVNEIIAAQRVLTGELFKFVGELSGSLSKQNENQATLNKLLARLADGHDKLREDLAPAVFEQIEPHLSGLKQQMGQLTENEAQHSGDLAQKISSEADSLREQVTDVTEALNEQSTKLGTLVEGINALKNSIESLPARVQASLGPLINQIQTITTQFAQAEQRVVDEVIKLTQAKKADDGRKVDPLAAPGAAITEAGNASGG